MAFITNQFLKGDPERARSSQQTQVVMKPSIASILWRTSDNITAEIKATRFGGDYQRVLFTAEDLRGVLPILVEGADSPTRQKIAHEMLLRFDDAVLVKFLEVLLSKRAAG